MKKFFTTAFACTLGTLIAGLILVFLSIIAVVGLVASSASSGNEQYVPKEKTVLKLNLSGSLQERYVEDPMENLLSQGNSSGVGLDQIRRAIEVATENENIIGIYIDARNLSAMPASTEEIRDMLVEFKEKSGKWIYSYADSYTQNDYFLASVSDSIILNPLGSIDIHGLGGIQMFFPGLLDKMGIEMKIFRVGTYKSAVEPYMCEEMSPANREQTLAYINSIWETFTEDITASRGFSAEHFNAIADSITAIRDGKDMLAFQLADTLMYRPEFDEWLKTKVGVETDEEINFASVAQLASITPESKKSKNTIAVVYAVGDIVDSGDGGIVGESFVPELTKIRKDENIKAVVLRVNSPGGSAYASEQIWAELEAIQAAGKKVVVSMGDMAASGGYYISCGADYIFAENTTLTGSIGVFGTMPVAEELMTEKLGLRFDEARTHKYGNVLNGDFLYQGFNQAEEVAVQRMIESTYDLFTRRCAEGRGMEQDSIKLIAEGRVWIGKTAVELGLVDEIGSIDDAIAYAAQLCEVDDYQIATYPAIKNSFDRLMEQLGSTTRLGIASRILGKDVEYLRALQMIENINPIQCRMENITIR